MTNKSTIHYDLEYELRRMQDYIENNLKDVVYVDLYNCSEKLIDLAYELQSIREKLLTVEASENVPVPLLYGNPEGRSTSALSPSGSKFVSDWINYELIDERVYNINVNLELKKAKDSALPQMQRDSNKEDLPSSHQIIQKLILASTYIRMNWNVGCLPDSDLLEFSRQFMCGGDLVTSRINITAEQYMANKNFITDFLFPHTTTKNPPKDQMIDEEFESYLQEIEKEFKNLRIDKTKSTPAYPQASRRSANPSTSKSSAYPNDGYFYPHTSGDNNAIEDSIANQWESVEDTIRFCCCSAPIPHNISIFRAKWICKKCELDIKDEK